MALASTTFIFLILALISNHLCPAKGQEPDPDMHQNPVESKFGRSDSAILPMPYGTKAPLMAGLGWGCPCDALRCGCDVIGCSCTNFVPTDVGPTRRGAWRPWILPGDGSKYPYQQSPWACPCDQSCRCDGRACGCSAPPDFGCPPNLGFCQCYPENAYCRVAPPGVWNTSPVYGGHDSDAQLELDDHLNSQLMLKLDKEVINL